LSDCCTPAYAKVFGARAARRAANRYRRKGLDGLARWMVDDLRARGVDGATVLELGGGVGAVQLELLRAGAARAVNVELSGEWEEEAVELVREHGVEGRIERRHADAVEDADTLAPADVVVMNRVVCCYPDPDALMAVASERAGRVLVLSFPRDRALVRLVNGLSNAWMRLRRIDFRSFVHPEPRIEAAARRHGLRPDSEHRGFAWRAVTFTRA
jgi:tRNA A58 N-methylase Trm61